MSSITGKPSAACFCHFFPKARALIVFFEVTQKLIIRLCLIKRLSACNIAKSMTSMRQTEISPMLNGDV